MTDSKIVPYVEFEFGENKELISSVILGAKNTNQENILREVLVYEGFDSQKMRIEKSSIPYR